jgi:mono/diheme cytochrome c family protein
MRKLNYIALGAFLATLAACGGGQDQAATESTEAPKSLYADKKEAADPMKNKGIGPVTSVELGPLDQAMADEGKLIYEEKCSACHKATEKYIGPAPVGILERRTPEWVMNMILNPEQMVAEDPIAKDLLKQFLSPMANQSLTEEQARKILEYFRTL